MRVFMLSDESLMKLAAREIQQYFAFDDNHWFIPTWMMIATWDGVTYYGGGPDTAVVKTAFVLPSFT